MKNILLIITVAVVLASCSGSAFMKRKYMRGNYHPTVAKASQPKTHDAERNSNTLQPVITLNGKISELPGTAEETKESPVYYAENKITKTQHPSKDKHAVATAPVFTPKKLEKIINDSRSRSQITIPAGKSGASDEGALYMILLVLCAIFIPPLACFLKEKGLNKWFWVTLILCLLSFTYFIFVFGGTLFFAAIVIALLHVFDVI